MDGIPLEGSINAEAKIANPESREIHCCAAEIERLKSRVKFLEKAVESITEELTKYRVPKKANLEANLEGSETESIHSIDLFEFEDKSSDQIALSTSGDLLPSLTKRNENFAVDERFENYSNEITINQESSDPNPTCYICLLELEDKAVHM